MSTILSCTLSLGLIASPSTGTGPVILTREDHDYAVAFCRDEFRRRNLGPGYTRRAFVIGCLRKINAGEDPTL